MPSDQFLPAGAQKSGQGRVRGERFKEHFAWARSAIKGLVSAPRPSVHGRRGRANARSNLQVDQGAILALRSRLLTNCTRMVRTRPCDKARLEPFPEISGLAGRQSNHLQQRCTDGLIRFGESASRRP